MSDRELWLLSLAFFVAVFATVIAYHLGRSDEMHVWWARVERGEFRLVLPAERGELRVQGYTLVEVPHDDPDHAGRAEDDE